MRYSDNINSSKEHNPSVDFGLKDMRVQKGRQWR